MMSSEVMDDLPTVASDSNGTGTTHVASVEEEMLVNDTRTTFQAVDTQLDIGPGIIPTVPTTEDRNPSAESSTIPGALDLSDSGVETDTNKEEPSTDHLLECRSTNSHDEIESDENIDQNIGVIEMQEGNISDVMSEVSTGDEVSLELNLAFSDTQKPVNGLVASLYSHPAYKTLIQELTHNKEKICEIKTENYQLKCENQRLKEDRSQDIFEAQLETLEKTIDKQQNEIQHLTDQSQQQAAESLKNYSQLKLDLETKLDKMTKAFEMANRDKEAAVMRYAMSEKEVIDQKKERESLDKRLKESVKEKDLHVSKLKALDKDKSRVCQILDVKCKELTALQRVNEKMKEDMSSREIKIKWTQNKLHTEMESHKETQSHVEKLEKQLQETLAEAEKVHRDCQSMMKAYQSSEDNKAFTLEQQLREQQAQLILERHERKDKEENYRQLQQEMEALKRKHQTILNENNQLSVKVQNLEKERLEYEQNVSKLKITMDELRQNEVDLQAQLSTMESIRIQLQHEQERLAASQSEVERLRLSNNELQQEMTGCRRKEEELLDFTEKLTSKNVRLQSEFSATEAKAQELETQLGPQQRQISDLEARAGLLSQQLDQEKLQRQKENQLLAKLLAEKTQRAEVLAQQLEDQQGENQVLKRKQTSTVKELVRELHQCRKRLDLYETSGSSSLGQTSRASSSTSLNALEAPVSAAKPGGLSPPPPLPTPPPAEQPTEPDRQALVEHIVKLQRANARKAEKLEFMEEHAQQLVAELQSKARILQSYILREQAGALGSESMEQNKAEFSRRGGIMASLYGSKTIDNTMSLELSLEINTKLQAVLEDTLLKNITLQNNIETLGNEISRLQSRNSSGS